MQMQPQTVRVAYAGRDIFDATGLMAAGLVKYASKVKCLQKIV
jgi:hypothetical protein